MENSTNKKIWLINHYAMPPEYEPRLRTIKFAEYLTKAGYDVTVFAASSMHNMRLNLITNKDKYIVKYYGIIKFVHIRTVTYNNYIQRVINHFQFVFRLMKIAKKFEKPDIILQTALVPFNSLIYFLAKRYKAKYLVEVLDLWPFSFQATGVISKYNPILPILYSFEKWQYKKADCLIFSMEGGKNYIIEKRWDKANKGPIDLNKVHYINNGVDLKEFQDNLLKYKVDDDDVNNPNTFKILYIGSIRLFNNVKLLIEAAEKLFEHKNIIFLIYGDGKERQELEQYVKSKKISNVKFKNTIIDKKYIPYLLTKSSVNVLNYQQNDVWKYGWSQSKMHQYLAAGRPIVANIVPAYCPIREYNCGISNEFKTSDDYALAFLTIKESSEEIYHRMCENALEAARNFDYSKLTDDLIKLF